MVIEAPKISPKQALNPVRRIYDTLYVAYGPQHWWPAETPFEVMVGAILTQNTAWHNVVKGVENLKALGALTPETILAASDDILSQRLRPTGYFNLKAKRLKAYCAWYMEAGQHDALKSLTTTALREALLKVPGIGPETADDILLYAFDRPVFVFDTYTRRLFSRLGCITGEEPYETLRAWLEGELPAEAGLLGEYHALIVRHAKEACQKRPRCEKCLFCLRCDP